jgi:hypothetical protein
MDNLQVQKALPGIQESHLGHGGGIRNPSSGCADSVSTRYNAHNSKETYKEKG